MYIGINNILWRKFIMLKDKFAISFKDGMTYSIHLALPEICPHCGKNMSPRFYHGVSEFSGTDNPESIAALLLQCVLCGKYFTRMFFLNRFDENGLPREIELSYTPPINANIPENIGTISDSFSEIYTQALQAKQAGLDQIYGMGLRKSLEFLVKDFGIYLHPEASEDIKKRQLGYVIDKYFTEFTAITALFKAATWIGNDETHYERKHPDKDAETIKRFISATMLQISSRLTSDEAMSMIEESAKPETKS